jgi:hypothetical protein
MCPLAANIENNRSSDFLPFTQAVPSNFCHVSLVAKALAERPVMRDVISQFLWPVGHDIFLDQKKLAITMTS